MCPGVFSDQPGDCPRCGMALERNPAWGPPEADDAGAPELRDLTRRGWFGFALTLPLFVVGMSHLIPSLAHAAWLQHDATRWGQALLATPVVFGAGWPLLRRGFRSLRTGHLNMFTLILLGVGAAWLFSMAALLAPGLFPAAGLDHGGKPHLYFEAAAVITVLVLLGQILEGRARQRTGVAVRALLDLAPKFAHRIDADRREHDVPVAEVQIGDHLRLRPGETVPVDAVVLEGRSDIDESMLTGEPLPVPRAPGDRVTAGTLNITGSLVVRAERVGQETVLAQIVQLVAAAQRSRAPSQQLADRVAAWFVPTVVAIALLSFLAWWLWGPAPSLPLAITNAVSVLIIACPCALGLATPMSVMVGVGRGAQLGILFREAAAIESLARIDTLALDKTGTLTAGRPAVVDLHPVDGVSRDDLLATAASLEQASEHPLARAIVAAAHARGLPLAPAADFLSSVGGGVAGTIDGVPVLVGSAAFLRANGAGGLDAAEASTSTAAGSGQSGVATTVFVARAGRTLGAIRLADTVKPTTAAALADLHSLGVRILMLTGDQPAPARALAAELHIDDTRAGLAPGDKLAAIRELQAAGRVVGMAGDGTNDAPALAAADVGLALGTGTDIARESADVVLVQGDLRAVPRAIRLSRALCRNLRQNLFFAFAYNALGVPVAAGVLYPLTGWLLSPIFAGIAMSLSSVSVITNALRLRRA